MRQMRLISLLTAVCLASGCQRAVTIISPAHNSQASLPIVFEAKLRSGATRFSAELDGSVITSHFSGTGNTRTATLSTADFPSLTPGSAHTFYARAYISPHAWTVRDLDDEHDFTISPLPSLSFSPSSLTVFLNASQNASVQLPPGTSGPVPVTLQPSNGNIRLNSASAGNPVSLSVSGSASFTIHGVSTGSSAISASASGFSVASIVVSIPTPDIRVQVSPNEIQVPWGQPATYSVQLQSQSGFAGAVTLTATDLPAGSTASFATNPVALAAGATTSVNMTLTTTEAVTAVDRTRFRVTGTSGSVTDNDRAYIEVGRKEAAFVKMLTLRTANETCGSSVSATVVATGTGSGVQFSTPLGSNNPAAKFSDGYQFSPHCRLGFVAPPMTPSGQVWINLFNLMFPSSTGASGINSPYNFQNAWAEVWFSPDDSLVAVVSPATASPRAWVINLYDIVKKSHHGNTFFDGLVSGIQLVGREVRVTVTTATGSSTFNLNY